MPTANPTEWQLLGLKAVEWVTSVGVAASIIWNLVNHIRAGRALKITRFERDVASPLLQAISALERTSDSCIVLLYSRGTLDERKKQIEDRLWNEAGLAHAALQRNLRRAIETPRSRFADWDDILDGDVDDDALDDLAKAMEASDEEAFAGFLESASRKFEEVSNRARSKIEREN